MKKLVSLMALCTVLLGAVALVGCGTKPAKGSVWKITKVAGVAVPSAAAQYFCFHSDGNAYHASKVDKLPLTAMKLGTYKIDSKTITINGESASYTLKGDKMTVKIKNIDQEMQKVSSPTEDEIKKAVVKQ